MIIYYFNDFDAIDEGAIYQLLPQLPQQQQEAIASTRLHSRKREIAISHLMLAYAIEHNREEILSKETIIKEFSFSNNLSPIINCQLSIVNCQFIIAEHGKPYLNNHDGIYFNISHCKEAIATAVSDCEIGIDIEGCRRFSDTLLERAFNEEEKELVRKNEKPEMEFARIWTRKESFFKWTGTGILIEHIKSVEEDAAKAHCTITTQQISPPTGNPFYLSIATKK